MSIRRRVHAHSAALIGAALWLATVAAQDLLPNAERRSASPLAAQAIDGGLRPGISPPRAVHKATDSHLRRMPANARYLRGSVIVKFRDGTSAARKADLVSLVAGRSMPGLSYAAFDLVALNPADDPEAVASRLSAQPDVAYAQARYRARPLFRPNDPLYPLQWNLPALDLERAWEINRGASPSVIVAVVDSGVAYTNTSVHAIQSPDDRRRRLPGTGHGRHSVCGRAGPRRRRPIRVAVRLHLGGSRCRGYARTWHACRRDDRPGDEQLHGRRGRRVQRQVDACEGDRRLLG
jgi:hypothetical protein